MQGVSDRSGTKEGLGSGDSLSPRISDTLLYDCHRGTGGETDPLSQPINNIYKINKLTSLIGISIWRTQPQLSRGAEHALVPDHWRSGHRDPARPEDRSQ